MGSTNDIIYSSCLKCDDCGEVVTPVEGLEKHFFRTGHIHYTLKLAGSADWRGLYGSAAAGGELSK